jgi:N-ethylmaleimide reductase
MPDVNLLSPLQLGPYTLNNRLVMAPLTRCRAQRDGVPTPIMAEYYGQRATAGLIISEATAVTAMGVGYPFTPGIWNEVQVAAWRPITEAVHSKGGRIFMQLWHVGRISHPSMLPDGASPVAPSAIAPAGEVYGYDGPHPYVTPRALDLAELPGIVADFRRGAQNALAAGFDGVEVHGANGYLLDQFLRDDSNRRGDAYGGGIDHRARLLLEVLEAVCSVWGSDRVGVRLSPIQPFNDMRDSQPEATFGRVVALLNPLKLAYLHITEMGKDAPGAAGPFFDVKKLRAIWQGVYMTNHGYDPAGADAALARGEADLVAFGALYIANPDLAERVARQAPLNAPDPATFYTGGPKGYTDYPFMK